MSFHAKVLLWMVAGVLFGVGLQIWVDGQASVDATFREVSASPSGAASIELVRARRSAADSKLSSLQPGDRFGAAWLDRGSPAPAARLTDPQALGNLVLSLDPGELVWLERAPPEGAMPGDEQRGELVALRTFLDPSSPRGRIVGFFDFLADLFLSLLKMLIVPLVLTSIVNGVTSVGSMGDLRRLGFKTFAYYVTTSVLAILLGQVLVNLVRPGHGAELGLDPSAVQSTEELGFLDILKRMIPENVPQALTSNGAMLQIIFFALLFGVFISKTEEPHGRRMREFFESAFAVMLRLAQGVLALLPFGVFALLVRVVGSTGLGVFEPLLIYMGVVLAALLGHALITLPLLLKFVGGISPFAWFKAMSPALMTAFSTSSSSVTLPVSLETVEERGRVSNRVTSFTLPLGSTINMDGTALYECIGVVFLAQYYASVGDFELTLASQALVAVLALTASIGAAGIPSAGLVMMLTILAVLGLPLEGAALLLAVDRPLDMLRTVVNIWSDSCGAALIARSEGESGPTELGRTQAAAG